MSENGNNDGGNKSAEAAQSMTETVQSSFDVELLEAADAWVHAYLSDQQYKVLPSGLLEHFGQREQTSHVLDRIVVQYDIEYKRANRYSGEVDPASRAVLDAAFAIFVREEWQKWLNQKKAQLRYASGGERLGELKKWVRACTLQTEVPDDDLTLNVVAHWIWQVKRKLYGDSVFDHIMLVLTGQQGSGKSTAIGMLTSPLEDYRLDLSISCLADPRHYHALAKNFVVVCDEMQGCNKTDIEVLKHAITTSTLSARRLYTNSIDTFPQSVSFIGTSNKAIDMLVKDESGMRRFFDLRCAEQLDWTSIDVIDPVALWTEVDETLARGYLRNVKDSLKKQQEDYRYKDSVESYLEETFALNGPRKNERLVDEVFRDYAIWCEKSSQRPFDKTYFSKRLKACGIELHKKARVRSYYLGTEYVSSRNGAMVRVSKPVSKTD